MRLIVFPTRTGCIRYESVEKARIKEESPEHVPEHELEWMPKPVADSIRLWAQSRVEAAALDPRPDPRVFGGVRWQSRQNAAEVALYYLATSNGKFIDLDAASIIQHFHGIVPFIYGDPKLGPFWVQQIASHWTVIAPRVRRSIVQGMHAANSGE